MREKGKGEEEAERETEEKIDGKRKIHEGTHKRRQTETLQLHNHVFAETMRNRKANLAGSVQLARIGKQICVRGELCAYIRV